MFLKIEVFQPLKEYWKEAVQAWKTENDTRVFPKQDFASVFQKTLEKIDVNTLKNGFRTCDLFPFDRNEVDLKKLVTKSDEDDTLDKSLTSETSDNMFPRVSLEFFEKKKIGPTK